MIDPLAWFRRRPADPSPEPPAVPPGLRVYAVGDVHGRADLLETLLAEIEADDRARGPAETHLVMLGDLIDRGPDTARILERLRERPPGFARLHLILGNHEEMLLRQIDEPDPDALAQFMRYGGRETLESYGVPERMLILHDRHLPQEIMAYVPEADVAFLRSFSHSVRFGDYLFVHAGIRPGVPIDEQRPSETRWIRGAFLESEADHGAVVVHGHTITAEPEIRHNRIGIDTGAYASGILTALALEGTDRWLIATQGEPG